MRWLTFDSRDDPQAGAALRELADQLERRSQQLASSTQHADLHHLALLLAAACDETGLRALRNVPRAANSGQHAGPLTAAKIRGDWTPRELRHPFVSLMSVSGVPVEEIARLAGHSSSRTTEIVYRRELRPILTTGAEVMDSLFKAAASG